MKTSEVLNKAADLIEERGWVQGASGWPDSPEATHPLCLEGGILAAMGLDVASADTNRDKDVPNSCPAGVAVREYLALADEHDLYEWNDDLATFIRQPGAKSAEQVIGVLRATAVIEAAREDAEAELAEWAALYPQLTAVAVEKAVDDARARILGDHPEPVEREVAVS